MADNAIALKPLESDKLDCFESIRGLAALAVLFGHIIVGFWPLIYHGPFSDLHTYPALIRWLPKTPLKVAYDAQLAVTIFFILSGFVLSLSFFKTGSLEVVASQAVRRYFRLAIPAGFSILLAYFILKAGWMYNQRALQTMQAHSIPAGWIGIFYNFPADASRAVREAFCNPFDSANLYNQNLWTMAVEFLGSFLVYTFVAVFGTSRRRGLLYLGFSACIFFNALLPMSHRLFMIDFLIGVALCDLYVTNLRGRQWSMPTGVALAAIAGAIWLVWKKPGGYWTWGPAPINANYVVEAVGGAIIIGSTAFCPAIQRALSVRPLTFLGQVSFGLYLIHLVLICSLQSSIYIKLVRAGVGHHVAAGIGAIACVIASFAIAMFMYRYVDRPSVVVGKWVFNTLFRQKKEPVQVAEPEKAATEPELLGAIGARQAA